MATPRPDDAQVPYRQIVEELRADIVSGRIPPDGKLPSNAELKRRYGVASQTAQNAINALKAAGLVYGVAGRGVFVRTDIDFETLRSGEESSDPDSSVTDRIFARMDEMAATIEALEGRVAAIEAGDRTDADTPGR